MSTFADGMTVLMLNNPFYSQLLMKLRHIEDKNVGTLCVSFGALTYNPDFLAMLDDDECVMAIAHEIQHCVLEHLPMMQFYGESGLGPDGKQYNHRKMNQAMDYSCNGILSEAGFKMISRDKFHICLDLQQYPTSMTSEEIYCKMPDDDTNDPMDEHDASGGGGSESSMPAISATDVIAAAEHHRALTGSYPHGIERILSEIRRPAVSPWKRLRRLVESAFPGNDRKTWKRLDRRMATRQIYMPGNTGTGTGRIGIVADTSGSITQDVLNLFGGHMGAIIDDVRPKDVMVYWVDDEVRGKGLCKNSTDLRAFLAKGALGGNGTNMPKGVQAAIDDKCTIVIVLTDGYTPFGQPSKVPVVWAITSTKVAPHGETVHING